MGEPKFPVFDMPTFTITFPELTFDIDAMMPDIPYKAVKAQAADNARLRALIKEAEWRGGDVDGDISCPWCGESRDNYAGHPGGKHTNDCPAFTPEGQVK